MKFLHCKGDLRPAIFETGYFMLFIVTQQHYGIDESHQRRPICGLHNDVLQVSGPGSGSDFGSGSEKNAVD
jgi:hypothetical protein